MCSDSRSPWWRAGVLVAAVLTLARCDSRGANAHANETVPTFAVPVGPFPGPAEHQLERLANPFEKNTDALREGRLYFMQYNCAGCHGDHGGGGMGPSLRDADWIYGDTHAQIAKSIAEGRALGMPAWGRMLTPTQIWQITAYIKSMRSPHEPDPPTGS